jgi:hypothetical protein
MDKTKKIILITAISLIIVFVISGFYIKYKSRQLATEFIENIISSCRYLGIRIPEEEMINRISTNYSGDVIIKDLEIFGQEQYPYVFLSSLRLDNKIIPLLFKKEFNGNLYCKSDQGRIDIFYNYREFQKQSFSLKMDCMIKDMKLESISPYIKVKFPDVIDEICGNILINVINDEKNNLNGSMDFSLTKGYIVFPVIDFVPPKFKFASNLIPSKFEYDDFKGKITAVNNVLHIKNGEFVGPLVNIKYYGKIIIKNPLESSPVDLYVVITVPESTDSIYKIIFKKVLKAKEVRIDLKGTVGKGILEETTTVVPLEN